MPETYKDRWISCDDDGLAIRGYYFPWGTKRVAYGDIASARRVNMGAATGRGRIWGTANPGYWASLDPGRPRKRQAIVLELGKSVRPIISPDDVGAVETCLRDHGVAVSDDAVRRGPLH